MKLTASILFFAQSALGFFFHESVLERSYPPSIGGNFLHRRQSQAPIVGNLSVTQAEAGYAAMCSTANSNTGSNAILADINNVTVNALAIETEFRNVAAQLAFIDSENLDTQKFSANWTVLTQQWTNILWASRNTASDTVAYCQEFIDTIMPFVANASGINVPPPTSIEVLQEYIAEAQTFQNNAKITADAFASLQTNLTIFSASFNNFAQKLKASDDAAISSLLVDIDALTRTINQLDKEISEVATALGITIFTDLAAVVLFPEFAPIIIGVGVLAVAGEGAAWGILANQRSAAANQRAKDQVTVQQLQQQETAIAQANSTLRTIANVTVPTMVNQLQAFNNIWNAVVSDCEQGITYLNTAETQSQSSLAILLPQIFWSTIEHVPCMYEQIIPALDQYAAGIASSSIPPPTSNAVSLSSNWKTLGTGQFRARVQSLVSEKAAALSGAHVV
ncbi:hypothetical protein CPB84DRAFT_1828838 [Gymnopilus junonius]|uniref:Uncharacterized protein n=1 Tax=Gymnopilus junonius TaxID=109634 RepID=A0A9P5THM7_GYMJU|nr:hypothetical protein CPB84DRAFT_1828838 [Gymnopilus junonius]